SRRHPDKLGAESLIYVRHRWRGTGLPDARGRRFERMYIHEDRLLYRPATRPAVESGRRYAMLRRIDTPAAQRRLHAYLYVGPDARPRSHETLGPGSIPRPDDNL